MRQENYHYPCFRFMGAVYAGIGSKIFDRNSLQRNFLKMIFFLKEEELR